jgi:two-component system cell cycle sensor histidine kinase/response regulator CckA
MKKAPAGLEADVRRLQREIAELKRALGEAQRRAVDAEGAAAASEERLKLVLEGAPIGTWEWDVATGKLENDERLARTLGYGVQELEATERSFQALIHPDDRPRFLKATEALLQGRDAVYEVEFRCQRKSGDWVLVLGRGKVIARDAAGRPERVAGTLVDITESRLEAEHFRKLASEQLVILNTIGLGIIYLKNRKVQWVNPAGARLFGYDGRQVLGQDMADFYASPEDYRRVGMEAYTHLATGTPYTSELRMKKKDGSELWARITGQAIDPRNADEGSIWILEDITARRQAEEALRVSEARFQRLLDNSSDAIAMMDRQGLLTMLKGPIEKVTGYKPEELIGKNAFDLIHPDDVESARRIMREAISQPGAIRRSEYRLRHRSGAWVPVEVVSTYLLDDPIIHGVVLNVRDVSERLKLQGQLQQAMKMEAIGRLAGGVAHDFNNLLTAIVGNVQLGRHKLTPADPLMRYFDQIGKAADSATALTRQLLAFSRRQIIEPIVLNLNDLIHNLEVMLKRLIGEDISLRTSLDADLGTVCIDPGQFEQVLVNLVVNARDAMPNGGKLVIETRNIDVDERYCLLRPEVQPGKRVLLSVTDTGHGMSDEVKRHLFEPFYTTKPKERGTGLGLAMTFGVVKQAGGSIEVYSEPGLGTSIKIYLPRMGEPAEKLVTAKPSSAQVRGTETILLVEDDPSVRDVVQAVLRDLGYTLLEAANGGEAFLLAEKRRTRIDLLMTDVVMPGMNGRELSERLRAIHPEMKVLFTSGYTEEVVVHHGVVERDVSFIGKPYLFDDLARKIRDILAPTD